jgi:iron(III) transport system substrate-binding protein
MHAGRLGIALALAIASTVCGCSRDAETQSEVVVYTSVDDVFARPIAQRFEESTGIRVRLVPDTEETKSTGLLNRLLAERARPQADVFWSGDPVRAALLKIRGVSEAYRAPAAVDFPTLYRDADGHWTGFSARARVLIYNTELVPESTRPVSIMDLVDARFAGRACIANPLFGTTSMHAAALFEVLGEERAREFFERFVANGGTILSSNGEVRRRVAAGDFALGITDTDDFNVARLEGQPVAAVYPDQEGMGTLIVPNAVLLIAGAPNSATGKRFIDFLLQPEIEQTLAESEAAQIPLRPTIAVPANVTPLTQIRAMEVDYGRLASRLDGLSTGFLGDWVARNSP